MSTLKSDLGVSTDNKRFPLLRRCCLLWLLPALTITIAPGCAGFVANLIHVAKGNLVPAECELLEGRKVAVVCVSDASSYGPIRAADTIARQATQLIQANVKKIQTVDQQTIEQWKDTHDWNEIDYTEIAKGVDAELIVAIDLISFSLHEGKTMYKGRSDVEVAVYDMTQDGKQVFRVSPSQIQYPRSSGYTISEISEREFRNRFVGVVARRVARLFYAYESVEDYAQDSTLIVP